MKRALGFLILIVGLTAIPAAADEWPALQAAGFGLRAMPPTSADFTALKTFTPHWDAAVSDYFKVKPTPAVPVDGTRVQLWKGIDILQGVTIDDADKPLKKLDDVYHYAVTTDPELAKLGKSESYRLLLIGQALQYGSGKSTFDARSLTGDENKICFFTLKGCGGGKPPPVIPPIVPPITIGR